MCVHACINIHTFILLFRIVDKTVCLYNEIITCHLVLEGFVALIRVVTMRFWGFNNIRIKLISLSVCPKTQRTIPDGLRVFDLRVEMFQWLM